MIEPRIALAMIVKGSDEEAKLLDRCLESVSPFVDGIFVTRTQPNDAVGKVVRKYKGVLSDFEWCNDFSKARNYNFSQVPKEFDYIMWTDADDVWRGLEKLKPTMTEHPHMDAFGFKYLYDWDEFNLPTVVHWKTQIVKNDGCVEWGGELHEDFIEKRVMDVHMVLGIERLHLTTKERAAENAKRNVEIAKKQVEENPEDPRSYWNLANSFFSVGEFKKSREAFTEFIEETRSDSEKYLAYMRLAEVYKALQDREKCILNYQYAIGFCPELPDAYFQLAQAYYDFANYDKAEYYLQLGLPKKPQADKMIVYNPRDYDYNPMMLGANIYYQKNRPHDMLVFLEACLKIYPDDKRLQKLVEEGKVERAEMERALTEIKKLQDITDKEELRKAIDNLPDEVRSHPAVCAVRNQNFIKETSSGKDLVIYCGNTSHQWNPELFKTKGFGGSEEAVVHLAEEWAKLGWDVTIYNNCGHKGTKPIQYFNRGLGTIGCVVYKPFWEWNYRDKQDVTILWRWAKPLDAEINSTKIFVDLHDVVPAGEFTETRLKKVDKIFVKTQFHRSLFPNVPDEKIAVIPNGLEIYRDDSIKKDPYLVINTSSPDRSMDVLPKLWKRVKEQVPQAKMRWYYGWDVYKASTNDPKQIAWMEETQKAIDEAGIESMGKVPQAEVGRAYQEASFLAYPSDFAEIDCISVKKAQAARCIPVTTDFGAFAESVKYGIKIHSPKTKDTWSKPYQFHFGLEDEKAQQEWVDQMIALLKEKDTVNWAGIEDWTAQFNWSHVAGQWNEILCA